MPQEIKPFLPITKEYQHFFINQEEIPGVQSVRVDFATSAGHLRYLGMNQVVPAPIAESAANLAVSALLISSDPFIGLTGNFGVNGYVLKSKTDTLKNFSFSSGYLTNYSIEYAVGQLPKIDATFQIFGDIGTLNTFPTNVSSDLASIRTGISINWLYITEPGSMNVSFANVNTNRLLSYQLKLDVPRIPMYILGKRFVYKVGSQRPITANCTFRFEISDLEFKTISSFPVVDNVESLSVSMRDKTSNVLFAQYQFNNLRLTSQTFETNVDGNSSAVLNYETLLV